MTDLAVREDAHALAATPEPSNEAGALISMIERAARDPAVDIDKMERLFQMHERAVERQARAAYASALAELQPQLPAVGERGGITNNSGAVTSTYALWEDINAAILPILSKHGFAISFRTGRSPEGQITVTGVLSHRLGHSEETTLALPVDSSGSKNSVQAVGSSTSYGKRYTAAALLNLTTRGEDDDGQAGGARGLSTAAEAAISGINLAETVEQLRVWRQRNEPGLEAFTVPEKRQIIELYTRRLNALRKQEAR